ncbi:hypothetical protein ARMGADRAFT_1048631 [Armillaria gallica]|uniref:Aminoglycoside phosphotransferase domain-containing protein n=1 Tax=Armillaria gallica TaxID=47427 RepID=A0A2H3D2E3_ARMGA|nr:hypothetical protein ARMGADRAFT_1048631 [Armillaria gallica]
MPIIAENTSVPVPKVWLHFRWKQLDYIVMQRMPGHLPDESKEIIVEQLAKHICPVLGGPVCNYRMYDDGNTGPFRDEAHLNLQLRCRHWVEESVPIVVVAYAKPHPLVFTHGNLIACNIMVQGTRVTAIIDWECAGSFPAHIEYY